MSIVITVVSKRAIIQVSDIRLSSIKNAEPLQKLQRKSTLVIGKQAAFVLGWAGFAETQDGKFNTGDWLFATLNHIKADELSLAEIAGDLTGQATYAFDSLRVPQGSKGCRFVLGGWHKVSGNPELFTGVVFNDLKFNSLAQYGEAVWTENKTAAAQFMYSLASFRPVEFPYNVQIFGNAKPEWIRSQMRILKKVMDKRGGTEAITRACVEIARKAAGHTRTISKDLIAVRLDKNGHALCSFIPEKGTEEALMPDIITPTGSTTQGTIRAIFSADEVSVKFRAKGIKR